MGPKVFRANSMGLEDRRCFELVRTRSCQDTSNEPCSAMPANQTSQPHSLSRTKYNFSTHAQGQSISDSTHYNTTQYRPMMNNSNNDTSAKVSHIE